MFILFLLNLLCVIAICSTYFSHQCKLRKAVWTRSDIFLLLCNTVRKIEHLPSECHHVVFILVFRVVWATIFDGIFRRCKDWDIMINADVGTLRNDSWELADSPGLLRQWGKPAFRYCNGK